MDGHDHDHDHDHDHPDPIMVTATVGLSGVTTSEFTPVVRVAFRQTVAEAVDVPLANVGITSISLRIRRVSYGLQVVFTVLPDSDTPVSEIGAAITTSVADTTSSGFANTLVTKARSQGASIRISGSGILVPPQIINEPVVVVPSESDDGVAVWIWIVVGVVVVCVVIAVVAVVVNWSFIQIPGDS